MFNPTDKDRNLIDAPVAAADVHIVVVMLMVANEQVVVHELEFLQAWSALKTHPHRLNKNPQSFPFPVHALPNAGRHN